MILADLIATRAERNPDFPVLTFECAGKEDEVRSFAELQERGNRIAAELIARGLQRGDRFALMMRNHPEFVETMIAASISATVFVPIDPRTKGEKLAYTLRNAGCKGILLADYNLAQLEEIRGSLPDLLFSLALETGEDGAPALGDFQRSRLSRRSPGPARRDGGHPSRERRGPAADHLHLGHHRGPEGRGDAERPLRGDVDAGKVMFQFAPDEKLYTGLSLTDGNAQAVTLGRALHRASRGDQPPFHRSRGCGTSAAATAVPPSRSSVAWPPPSTASR